MEANESPLASHYPCLIRGLDFPISHVLAPSDPTELQIGIPFPESAPITSSCGLY